MNKKQKLVLGVSIVVLMLGFLIFTTTMNSSMYEVRDAVAAKQNLTDKVIIINGTMVTDTENWVPEKHTFTFKLTDGIETIGVIFTGEKPNISPQEVNDTNTIQAVVTGQFDKDVFKAYKMLTKCPSKYEASPENIARNKT